MWDVIAHRLLKLPYQLHIYRLRRVRHAERTIVFIHGIGNSGASWDAVISKLPSTYSYIALDLVGFGQSPKPHWQAYHLGLQARSVFQTLLRLGLRRHLTVVGHSLGSLVAVEFTKRYAYSVDQLVLASPPFYTDSSSSRFDSTKFLKRMYQTAQTHPYQFKRLANLAARYHLTDKAFQLNDMNLYAYMETLELSIVNQTSLEDAKMLTKPTIIIYGRFDPVVLTANLKEVSAANNHVQLRHVAASHDMFGTFPGAIVRAIG